MIDGSLGTLSNIVQKLQSALHAKAKAEPNYRFYTLWDKIYREDILTIAYLKCRRNAGSHSIDEETFSAIDQAGVKEWIGKLQEELRIKTYEPQPL
ncbi:hypothetical protein Lmac_2782 [Legionella maceachernii]|uniref:Uncharacterized protein n=1 Tax=Legionella maceachernii TaxID=466 RepID=A0A0W0VV84_9GAMM|nr:hypothetical protein Lmac_2782 [Legionella maceachernii]SKA17721.1 hypothetical protein SAMN02745128_02409 [Legionella maceachernii]SUP04559.1 Uncharacterised protein [Legionella maceachernii]